MTGRRPSDALREHLAEVREIISRYPVRNPRVFGSVARGEDRAGSDIDLLVDPTERTSLFDVAGLQLDLEDLLGVKVDVATPGALWPEHRDRIFKDARAI
jgi:uncharacterized protein